MKTIITENTHLDRAIVSCGWGNGYVLLPVGHPAHGKHYDDINVDVHYGLTYSNIVDKALIERVKELKSEDEGCWMIGFDTCHYNDSLSNWPKERVQEEADRLLQQIKSKFE